jgi:hypothetical protein
MNIEPSTLFERNRHKTNVPKYTRLLNGITFRQRARAGAVHFLASFAVAMLVTIPLVFLLYPSPFFQAAGGLHLLAILLGVDTVIGPLLTILVYNRAKKSLKSDLSIIVVLQVVALIYGLYATIQSRPVFMTYVVDRYEMVSYADVDVQELKKGPLALQHIRWGHPQLAYAEQPTDTQERELLMFSAMQGVDLNRLFRYYKPAELAKPQIIERAKRIEDLYQFNDRMKVDNLLAKHRSQPLAFVPMQGIKRDLTALVNRTTGELIEVIDLRPWADTK